MKRGLLLINGLTMAVLLALPGAGNAQTGPRDSVTGNATGVDSIGRTFVIDFDAFSGPSGENPGGTVTQTEPQVVVAQVTCLAVTDNRAVIGLVIEDALYLYNVVVDGGATRQDASGVGIIGSTPATECTTFPGTSLQPFLSGNVVVTDAQPFPTSKDQCKNGGWRNYGTTFKNQGQCVAFVQRGPKA